LTVAPGDRSAVAVAVVSWNTRERLRACLLSLLPDAQAGRADVWVVDNASSDGSAEMVRADFPWVTLIESETNLGFGAAVNRVARETDSGWIAPANADTEVCGGALECLLEAGEGHPRAAVIAPRLELPDESTQHSVYAFPTLPFTVIFNLGLQRLMPRLGDRLCLEGYWDPARARSVDWAIGAFLLVRRSAWDAVDGFDREQWMYAEDLDLGWRLARRGWRTRYEPRAVVRHDASSAAIKAWGEERTARWMDSTYDWLRRRRGPVRSRLTAAVNVAGALARAALLSLGARVDARRFGWKRDVFATWARLHWQAGIKPRPGTGPAEDPRSR
jgi:N-acetylglucosaminyl-diphospho-decaprenol L-rhamnosyltransferase